MDPSQLATTLDAVLGASLDQPVRIQDVNAQQPFWQWSMLAQALAPVLLAQQSRVVAITGSQGSGKSTLAKILVQQLNDLGLAAVCVSLDDFYLSKQDRVELGRRVHPLLVTRGVPGTHDSQLMGQVLKQMSSSTGSVKLQLPQFDKGLDDRVADIEATAELLVIEGWCLGVQPQPAALLEQPVNELEHSEDTHGIWRRWSNEQIQQHYLPLWSLIDEWVLLQPPEFAQVLQWRRQQELALPSAQRMNETQLQRFIQHYQRLTQWQWQRPIVASGIGVGLTPQHGIAHIRALTKNR